MARRPVLEALIAAGNGRFRGIRHGVTWDTGNAAKFGRRQVPPHQVLDPVFRKGFAHLQAARALIRIMAVPPAAARRRGSAARVSRHQRDPQSLRRAARHCAARQSRRSVQGLARQYPRSRAVSQPDRQGRRAGHDSTAAGISTCATRRRRRRNWPRVAALLETCIEAFGPNRCMMESNFPVDKQSCRLRRAVERPEAHHAGLHGGGEAGDVSRHRGAGLPAGGLIARAA